MREPWPISEDEKAEILSSLDAAERFAGDVPEPSKPGPVTR